MRLDKFLVGPEAHLHDIIEKLNRNSAGIVIVVDNEGRLIGTITDGDVRRAVLGGCEMSATATEVFDHKDPASPSKPIAAAPNSDEATLLHLMTTHRLRQIPIIDEDRRVIDVALLENFIQEREAEMQAVLMAGGLGKRLHPLTQETPKPMLKLAGRPIMEHIVQQLRDTGIEQVSVATHFKHEVIAKHFGDGREFGVNINYVHEDDPLGTAGALGMMPRPHGPVLVMNGDILTNLNFRAFFQFHRDNDAVLTAAVRPYEFTVPYGVMETDGVSIVSLKEKPTIKWMINAGIYILDPTAFDYIPSGTHLDMTELIDSLITNGCKTVCFPLHEYWRDIGHMKDFVDAKDEIDTLLSVK